MPRTETANQRIRDAQREKILDAARIVFARKGIDATMDDVAAEAGVSHGLAYRYFSGKGAIFQALLEQAVEQSAGHEAFQNTGVTPGKRIDRMLTAFIESRRQPEMYLLLGHLLSDETAPESLRAFVRERFEALRAVLKPLIIEGQTRGEIADDDPEQLVRAVFASLDGLIRWAIYDPKHYGEHYPDARIFLRLLKPEHPVRPVRRTRVGYLWRKPHVGNN